MKHGCTALSNIHKKKKLVLLSIITIFFFSINLVMFEFEFIGH